MFPPRAVGRDWLASGRRGRSGGIGGAKDRRGKGGAAGGEEGK